MTRASKHWLAIVILALVCLVPRYGVLALLQGEIDRSRAGLLDSPNVTPEQRLVELGTTVMLGSFRTALVSFLWYRADQLKQQREHIELEGVIRFIAKVQPTDIEAYCFQVWNMGYNVQYDASNVVEAWKWIKRAIDFGKEGVDRNPNHPKIWRLYFELGQIYFHRCATAVGARTAYFRKKVEEEEGRSPFDVAAYWFERAWKAGIRPDARRPNVHWLAMWAHTYARMATEAEEAGDVDEMIRDRNRAIELHELIMNYAVDGKKRFPEYERAGKDAVARLRRFIDLHQARRQADQFQAEGRLDDERRLRVRVAREWRNTIEKDPTGREAGRNVGRAADELESLLARVSDTKTQGQLRYEILETRYSAAHPQRRSKEAVDKLEAAVAVQDQRLAAMRSPQQLVRSKGDVRRNARIWHRIVSNLSSDRNRAQKALEALTRYDSILGLLAPGERRTAGKELWEYWLALINLTDIDAPLARRRVTEVATAAEKDLLLRCQAVVGLFNELGPLPPGVKPSANQARILSQVFGHTTVAHGSADTAVPSWAALLRKEEFYRTAAQMAEQHLRAIAEALETVADAAEHTFGEVDEVREKWDPRGFGPRARGIWRLLHEYNPRNLLYKEKSRRPVRKRRPRPRAHEH